MIEIDTNFAENLTRASARAEAAAIYRVRDVEARMEIEVAAAGDDTRMNAEIRTRASINTARIAAVDAAQAAADAARRADWVDVPFESVNLQTNKHKT